MITTLDKNTSFTNMINNNNSNNLQNVNVDIHTHVMNGTPPDNDRQNLESYLCIPFPESPSTSSSLVSSSSSANSPASPRRKGKKRIARPKSKKMEDDKELKNVTNLVSNMSLQHNDNQDTESSDPAVEGSGSRRSSMSSIKIEIGDIWGEESVNFTTSTLKICKEQVLRPYWYLLVFIGWRGFWKESVNASHTRWRVLNFIYSTIIILLLLYDYLYEILACEWKLSLSSQVPDTTLIPPIPMTTKSHPNTTTSLTNDSLPLFDLNQGVSLTTTGLGLNGTMQSQTVIHNKGCDHIVSTYLIPNTLHLVAYVMGLYYFRLQENEQLYALMEKVFLQATPMYARSASQKNMIVRLRVLLAIGSVWVFFTVLIQCLYVWAFNFPEMPLFSKIGKPGYYAMLILELFGRTVFNSVILAIVMNYVTQCEMIKFYVRGLTTRLQEKSTDLKAAMKDLLTIRHSVSLLNGIISKMTSIVAFINAELVIIGLCILFVNNCDDYKIWIYRSFFPFAGMFMLAIPLWQAARVNSIILRIKKISLEMRVFGYKGASILDLDSFLQFVSLIRPKAKLFHLPIMAPYLIFAVVLTAFVVLLLIQTGNIPLHDYIV